jgi:hypothetical protein
MIATSSLCTLGAGSYHGNGENDRQYVSTFIWARILPRAWPTFPLLSFNDTLVKESCLLESPHAQAGSSIEPRIRKLVATAVASPEVSVIVATVIDDIRFF